ncbi:hypothetical protein ACFV1L_09710 [Kitasatospora sp. NPDC059646]|uniref:hypothetical protein n=1 Tax=Kitasatospora sp. NPDC059646 TaxID=3346893 RepID=UPI0036929F1C
MTTTSARPAAVPSVAQLPQPGLRTSADLLGSIPAAVDKDFPDSPDSPDFRHLPLPGRRQGPRPGPALRAPHHRPAFTPGGPKADEDAPTGLDEAARPGGPAGIARADGTRGTVDVRRFVRTTGAPYAVAPSISTLRLLAEGQDLPRRSSGARPAVTPHQKEASHR